MSRRAGGRPAAVVVAVLVVLAAVAGGALLVSRDGFNGRAATASAGQSDPGSSSSSAAELARRLGPGVFRVEVEGCGQEGSGSGFAIDAHHVVTNHHVVGVDPTPELVGRDGARRQGRVIGWRQSPDIAVIHVDQAMPVSLPWADTGSLTEGQSLVALGYPVPDLDFSVTDASIVSFQSRAGVRRAVRTDGALDRGNSGGPALTAAGEVAGVVTEMEANESGLQLVALLYTADALAADVQAILDRPTSVDATCDAGREMLPEEWWADYADADSPAQAYGYGDDAQMDALQDACADGDMSGCDGLYEVSPYDSAYEAYGATCGLRTGWMAGSCASWGADPGLQPDWPAGSETQVDPNPMSEPAPEPDVQPAPEPDVQPAPEPDVAPEPETGPAPDVEPAPDPEQEPDIEPAPEPEPQGEMVLEDEPLIGSAP